MLYLTKNLVWHLHNFLVSCIIEEENFIIATFRLKFYFLLFADDWLVGCRFESNSPLVGPGTIGGVHSVGVFLRDSSWYLHEFQRKPRKTPNG